MSTELNEVLTKIAQKHLGVATLETRNSDGLDFHDCHVASIKAALHEAFAVGFAAGKAVDDKG